MNVTYLKTTSPNGHARILMRNLNNTKPDLYHYILVLNDNGQLWVDVFWPYDEDYEALTTTISETQFWRIFREWRLSGLSLGDSSFVAEVLAKKQLRRKQS